MLTPSERWSWTYCAQRDRLLLDISEQLQFCSELSAAQLTEKPQAKPLSMAEAQAFWNFRDSLQPLNLTDAGLLELCLHALAAGFAQQAGHKSWYFAEQAAAAVAEYQLVQLVGMHGPIPALVLQRDGDCASCLLLTEGYSLSGKLLKRCSILRLLSNRLAPVRPSQYFAQSA
ncbi:hypothetical protein WG68_04595 [Arsukibacterium ikkense]|uniref:Cell division protein ZapC n=1 Tax=Arsukibacterium ikkense TaxID=336831 RepID=A0A0M2V7H8_9GAMM|nr:cell division protein ZapC domain-containing protein [Arsukibacterium ikkense]KKO46581.1 hypothetical protein WG68_04595 [Arsukibacterium ikkense]